MTTKYSSRYENDFPWAAPDPKVTTNAFCTWCKKSFKIDTMGRVAFVSHEKSKGHQHQTTIRRTNMPINCLFGTNHSKINNNPSTSALHSANDSTTSNSTADSTQPGASGAPTAPVEGKQTTNSVMQKFFLSDAVTNVEVLWALETVATHGSYRSAGSSAGLFPRMFPDSQIASKMEMSRTKVGYFITHGLAPYFKNRLLSKVQNCSEVVLGFDETLNKIVQRQQMDMSVGFWDEDAQEVQRRYVGSAFLTSARAVDLLGGIKTCFEAYPGVLKKFSQVSMDGPNVNLRLFSDLSAELQTMRESDSFGLLNIGSCGLHTVHNSFKNGMQKTEWKIDRFLTSLYYLLIDIPLRRDEFSSVTGSTLVPLKFCGVRWVENQRVAGRALEMLPHIRCYVKAIEDQHKTKRKENHPDFKRSFKAVQRSSSYSVVSEMVADELLGPKLAFFMASAATVEPFLTEFQGEAPLVPFLYDELANLVRNVMQRVFKADKLNVKPKALLEVAFKEEHYLTSAEVDIGFSVKAAIKAEKQKGKLSEAKVLLFRKDCKDYYIAFLKKMFERSPLRHNLTRYVSCLNPSIITDSSDFAKKRLDFCLEHLVEKDHMAGTVADKVKEEFSQLCSMGSFKCVAANYRRQETRIDHFWSKAISNSGKQLPNLKSFIKKVLVLSHGNAVLERGFSVNKECLVENQSQDSLVAQRIVHDAITCGGGIENIEVDKKMLQYCRSARSRYQEYLDGRKAEDETKKKEMNRKREAEREIKELESKKAKLLAEAEKEVAALDSKLNELRK